MSQAYMEVHVFVIWPWAKRQRKIERYINKNFFVLDRFQPDWEHLSLELGRFYGFDDPVEYPGDEPPKAYVVRVSADRAARLTSRGRLMVNPFLFDAKSKLRKWGGKSGHLNSVHGSDSQDEALENLKRLVPKYPDFETMLNRIPGKYVILRNFEGEPDHGDVDILVEDLEETVDALRAVRVDAYSNFTDDEQEGLKNKYLVGVEDRIAILDFRYVGDEYLDEQWQEAILRTRVKRGFLYSPNDHHWYWTLLYHSLIHKGDTTKYEETLDKLDSSPHTRRSLARYMQGKEYRFTQPADPLLSLFGVFVGVVADGRGWASKAPQAGLQEQWEKACGYMPYPGTFNIQFDGKFVMPKPIQTSAIAVIDPVKGNGYTNLYFWNALINGYPCVLSTGGNLPGQAEILADVHLRTELGLETGDRVEVVVV